MRCSFGSSASMSFICLPAQMSYRDALPSADRSSRSSLLLLQSRIVVAFEYLPDPLVARCYQVVGRRWFAFGGRAQRRTAAYASALESHAGRSRLTVMAAFRRIKNHILCPLKTSEITPTRQSGLAVMAPECGGKSHTLLLHAGRSVLAVHGSIPERCLKTSQMAPCRSVGFSGYGNTKNSSFHH